MMMMSRFSGFELFDHSPFPSFISTDSSLLSSNSLTFSPHFPSFLLEDHLDLLHSSPAPPLNDFPSFFADFYSQCDPIHVEKSSFCTSVHRLRHRIDRLGLGTDLYLQSLCDRVSALELNFDSLVRDKKAKFGERKYSWKAEIQSPDLIGFDRKYKWTAEIKDGKKIGGLEKNFEYKAEIKGKGRYFPITRTYTFKASNGNAGECSKLAEKQKNEKENKDKKKSKLAGIARVVEIQGGSDHELFVPRQAYARRVAKVSGKRKELTPQDAAMKIQESFRAHLIRRSQALLALRELAIAKSKLKEIRALFHNFSYRRRISLDAEERQRFSERIIVLLLTVDAIEGVEKMVQAAKKSMVHELEAMLEVVDPQPAGKSLSMRRRAFDMPNSPIQKELAAGVAQVVQMLEQEPNGSESFEGCL